MRFYIALIAFALAGCDDKAPAAGPGSKPQGVTREEVVADAANAVDNASEAVLEASRAVGDAANAVAAAGAPVSGSLRTSTSKSHKSGSKASGSHH